MVFHCKNIKKKSIHSKGSQHYALFLRREDQSVILRSGAEDLLRFLDQGQYECKYNPKLRGAIEIRTPLLEDFKLLDAKVKELRQLGSIESKLLSIIQPSQMRNPISTRSRELSIPSARLAEGLVKHTFRAPLLLIYKILGGQDQELRRIANEYNCSILLNSNGNIETQGETTESVEATISAVKKLMGFQSKFKKTLIILTASLSSASA